MSPTVPSRSYEVVVEDMLDDHWVSHSLTFVDGQTVIGPIPDESALHAVLARIRDLGLRLVSVRRVA